jgi:cell division septum initiation protein DivIVA
MAKALLGQYAIHDDRLASEAARLRARVHDLQALVERLQVENDRLRSEVVLLESDTRDTSETADARLAQPV